MTQQEALAKLEKDVAGARMSNQSYVVLPLDVAESMLKSFQANCAEADAQVPYHPV